MADYKQIRVRRDTLANWQTANPTLADGEPVWVSDTRDLISGPGAFNALWAAAQSIPNRAKQSADAAAASAMQAASALPRAEMIGARVPVGVLGGQVVIADNGARFGTPNQSNGTDTDAYARTAHLVLTDGYDFRLVYANVLAGKPGSARITIDAGVEPPVSGFTAATSVTSLMPVTFDGAPTVVLAPGAYALSDPLPISVAAKQLLYVRTHVSVTAGSKWSADLITSPTGVEQEGVVSGTAPVPGYMSASSPTPIGSSYNNAFAPVGVIATPPVPTRSYLGIGDSIMYGLGTVADSNGFLRRASNSMGVGVLNVSVPGATAQGPLQATNWPALSLASSRYTATICEYGSNDCDVTSITFGQIQLNLIALWRALQMRGQKVHQTTITPRTTSTDAWMTLSSQNPKAPYTSMKSQLNTWLRAGAPITSTFGPALIGAPGALVIGNPLHPLAGVFDLAALVESSTDSGLWRTPTGRTFTGTNGTNDFGVQSPDAAFSAADVGESLRIGTNAPVEIVNVPSGTQAQVRGILPTATSSGPGVIGIATSDGIHPSSSMHRLIAVSLATYLAALPVV
jgi:lysophospholipase L1-like esterase